MYHHLRKSAIRGRAGDLASAAKRPAMEDSSATPKRYIMRPSFPADGPPGSREDGTRLPERLRATYETWSGLSLADVRVHRNSPQPARLDALAFAQGRHIHLAAGQERHLPHEAWHVVQQRQGRVLPTLRQGSVAINDEQRLEREADTRAEQVAQRSAWGRQDLPPRTAPSSPAGVGSPPGTRVTAQLARAKSRRSKALIKVTGGKISNVPEFGRGSTNLGGGRQGSHRTANVVIRALGRNNLKGRTLDQGRVNLKAALKRLKETRSAKNAIGQHKKNLELTERSIDTATTPQKMTDALMNLQQTTELLPGASGARGSLTGHGEAANRALLDEYEDRLTRSKKQRYSAHQVAEASWSLQDFKPSAAESHENIADELHKHMIHLKNTWPKTMKETRENIYGHLQQKARLHLSSKLPKADLDKIVKAAENLADSAMNEDVE